MSKPRMLFADIETTPIVAHVWNTFKPVVAINQILEPTRMMCFAAKWRGEKRVEFRSEHHDGHEEMVRRAHGLLDEADIVVHFNGERFDMPHLRREFLHLGLAPTSPVLQIDLLKTARRQFKFASNKLAFITRYLGQEGKVQHEGHGLWIKCMAGDEKAWLQMRKYNRADVTELEELYDKLLPWITGHPHMGLYDNPNGEDRCNKCGGADLERRGLKATQVGAYPQYRCKGCGGWSRGKRAVQLLDARAAE